MHSTIKQLLNSSLVRYFVMAGFVVLIELGAFALINSVFGISYLIATPVSMLVGIILNWYFSRVFVFKTSVFKKHTEFMLVFIASIVGVGIQLAVTALAVEILNLLPIIGKFMAIMVTFFWNFWVRKRYIFNPRYSRVLD